jgi:ketosteroid isomerase-like protein
MNAVMRSVLLVLACLIMSCSPSAGLVDSEDLARWLAAYGSAWEGKDAALVATLFTEDATYQETPYAEPFRGRAEISNYWASVTADQENIEFDFAVLSVGGNTGVAEWSARFRSISGDVPVELNGVFVLEFADADQVSSLREWWHVR